MEDPQAPHIRVDRPLYDHHEVRENFEYFKDHKNLISKFQSYCHNCNVKKSLSRSLPIIKWLSKYNWKNDLMADFISGFTVAVMHIPQGMAYAMLGNVPPIVGIYMAFFPVLIYVFFGTSMHNSMGTFAVVCLMTGKTVLEYSDPLYFSKINLNSNTTGEVEFIKIPEGYSPIEVASVVTFTVAIVQLLMYLLRLGIVSALLSDTLVSGFTTGAAVQVLTSQLKDIFGLRIPKFKGYFVVCNVFMTIFKEISNVNYAALIIASTTILFASLNNEFIKPRLAKKTPIPIPMELIAVVIGTTASKYFNLPEEYNITIVGNIPSGIPEPTLPRLSLLPTVIVDGITIAIVAYTISLSMALIFAQKLNYEIDANQELLAQGLGNMFGSFFSCMPFTASLSRSLIQQTVGGKTQIVSVVSCSILIFVLLWIGPFFEPLPKSVLAAIIVVALKGMFMQIADFIKFWKVSKLDAMVWMSTFLTVVIIGVDIGLLVGVVMSLATIMILGFKPYTCLLGSVPHTDLFLDTNKYKGAVEIPGIKIFQYCGGINFATRSYFRDELCRLVGINPQKEIIYRKKIMKYSTIEGDKIEKNEEQMKKVEKIKNKMNLGLKSLILDFSSLSYIDPAGIQMLKTLTDNFQKLDIPVYIAGCKEPVYDIMLKCGLLEVKKSHVRIFPTVSDAVQCASDIFNTNEYRIASISRL